MTNKRIKEIKAAIKSEDLKVIYRQTIGGTFRQVEKGTVTKLSPRKGASYLRQTHGCGFTNGFGTKRVIVTTEQGEWEVVDGDSFQIMRVDGQTLNRQQELLHRIRSVNS